MLPLSALALSVQSREIAGWPAKAVGSGCPVNFSGFPAPHSRVEYSNTSVTGCQEHPTLKDRSIVVAALVQRQSTVTLCVCRRSFSEYRNCASGAVGAKRNWPGVQASHALRSTGWSCTRPCDWIFSPWRESPARCRWIRRISSSGTMLVTAEHHPKGYRKGLTAGRLPWLRPLDPRGR